MKPLTARQTERGRTMVNLWIDNDLLIRLDEAASRELLSRAAFGRRAIASAIATTCGASAVARA